MTPAHSVDTFLVAMAEQLSVMDLRGLLSEGCLEYFSTMNPQQSISGNFAIGVAIRTTALARPMRKVEVDIGIQGTTNIFNLLEAFFIRGVPPSEFEGKKLVGKVRGNQYAGKYLQEKLRRDYLNKLLMPVLLEKVKKGLNKKAT